MAVLGVAAVANALADPRMIAVAQEIRPDVVVIVTDDQRFDSLFTMRATIRLLARHGLTMTQAVASNSLCCPARASLLTGGYSHTTGVYTNAGPHGGWHTFRRSGSEAETIAVDLDAAGYRTALFGKYMNRYDRELVPPGWDVWSAFLEADAGGAYYDYRMYEKDRFGERTVAYGRRARDYSTNVIRDKAVRFIATTSSDQPLFMVVAPFAVHDPIIPARRDIGTYDSYTQRLPPSFNEADVSDKPRYIRGLPLTSLNATLDRYRRQYETLQAADRLVRAIVVALRRAGRLHSSLVVFTTDQGVESGEHRWTYKATAYEESIRTPLIVRYDAATPRRVRGSTTTALVGNVDVAPTIADAAGLDGGFDGVGHVDGVSAMPLVTGDVHRIRRAVLLEHLDESIQNHVRSFCGLRTRSAVYVRYDTREEELYSLRRDPYELRNRARGGGRRLRRMRRLTRRACDPRPPGYTWR